MPDRSGNVGEDVLVSTDLEQVLADARQRREVAGYADLSAWAAVLAAERDLAESKGEQWAEVIDLGVRWSGGAPLPHLVSNGSTAVLICHAEDADPHWNGTHTRVVSPSDGDRSPLLRFTFDRCHSVKFGGPNDEALHGHPLDGHGLSTHDAHLVHNSTWLEQERQINSVHDHHSDSRFLTLNHYLLSFHDDTFEALADSVTIDTIEATTAELLLDACRHLVGADPAVSDRGVADQTWP